MSIRVLALGASVFPTLARAQAPSDADAPERGPSPVAPELTAEPGRAAPIAPATPPAALDELSTSSPGRVEPRPAPPDVRDTPLATEQTGSPRTSRVRGPQRSSPAAVLPRSSAEAKAPPIESVLGSGGRARRVSSVPANLLVVTRQEMVERGQRSVAELLATLPGFYVTSDGSLTSVAVRGVGGGLQGGTRRLQLLVNGVPVSFRPEQRAFLGPESVPFEAIERVEIALGPLTSVLGSNSELVAINVVTREAAPGTRAGFSGTIANLNTHAVGYGGSGFVSYQGELAHVVLGVSSYTFDRSGLRIEKTFAAQDPTASRYAAFFADESRRDYSTPSAVLLQISVPTDGAGTLGLDAGLSQLDANTEFRLNSVLTHGSRESLRNAWLALRHENRWSDRFATRFHAAFSAGSPTRDDQLFRTLEPAQSYQRNFGYRAVDSTLVLEYAPSERFAARLGMAANVEFQDTPFFVVTYSAPEGNRQAGERVELVSPTSRRQQTLSDRGAYLELEASPIPAVPALSLVATARADRVAFGATSPPWQLGGRGAVLYTFTPWLTAKLMYGRGFYAPSAVLLFSETGFGISDNLIGNLTPGSGVRPIRLETVSTAQAQVSLNLAELAFLDVAAFSQVLKDKVEFAAADFDYVARNAGTERTRGGELALRSRLGPVRPFVSGAWAFSANSQPLTAYPKFVGAAGLAVGLFQRPRLGFDVSVRHVSSRAGSSVNRTLNGGRAYVLPAYQTVDLALSTSGLRLFGADADTTLVASARNLFDERHSEAGYGGFDVPAAGRTASFEVRQTF